MSITGIPELRQSYRQLGAARFVAIIAAILAWCALGVWLQTETGWPRAYGFQCHGHGCLFADLWHSPALIRHGGGYPIALFCYFWSFIAVPLAIVAWLKLRQRRRADDLSVPVSKPSHPE